MTQKLKTLTKIFLSCLVFILCSCEKENIDVNNQDAAVTNAKNWFEKSKPELSILKYTKQIDWNHAIVTDGANGKVVEIPIVLNDNIALKSDNKSLITYNRLMFIADEKGTYKLSHVLITTKEKTFTTSDKAFNFYKIKDGFEGYITVLNTKNKVDSFNNIKKKSTSSVSGKMKSEEMICIGLFEIFSDGSSRFVGTLFCDGQGAGGDGSGGSGGYGGDGSVPALTTTQIIERNINDTQLTPCYKGVMDELKKGDICEIKTVFDKLNGDLSKCLVTFKNGTTDYPSDEAQTRKTYPNVKFNYTITYDADKHTSGTQLFKANMLLHELTHAYFYSLIDEATSSSNSSGLIDTPTLFKAFVDNKYISSVVGDTHHIEMANTYVDAISSALQEFQTGETVPYGTALQGYKDLAWYGLLDTKVFKDKSADEQNRIKNRYDTESRGGSIGGQQLIGKPCN